jgi:hypothetical protein
MVSVPVSGPVAMGEKLTLIVQEPPAATLPPQLLVWPKLALAAMPVMASAALPVLLRVTGCDPLVVPKFWLPNVRLPGETPATEAVATPVPVKLTVCELPLALSVIVKVPVRVPAAVGVKVTLIVQLAPALTLLPQVLVWEKSPLAVMLEMVSVALPVLVRVTICAVLLVPDNWAEKVSEEDDKLTAGPVPVPLKPTVCGLFAALSVIVRLAVSVPRAKGAKVMLIAQFASAATEPPQVLVWA